MKKVADVELIENQDKMLMSQVLEAIRSIRYGYVQITIHDSQVVQIDKTEKIRLRRPREGICSSQPENGRLGSLTCQKKLG